MVCQMACKLSLVAALIASLLQDRALEEVHLWPPVGAPEHAVSRAVPRAGGVSISLLLDCLKESWLLQIGLEAWRSVRCPSTAAAPAKGWLSNDETWLSA